MARTRGVVVRVLAGAALVAPWLAAARTGAVLPRASATVRAAGQPGTEAHVLELLDGEREREGLPPLESDSPMAAMARAHSQDMASADRIFHDAAKEGLLGRCSVVGENVGRAATVDIVHQAFMASPVHRSDILGPYDRVGVGVAAGSTTMYVTEVFCRSSTPGPQPSPSAPKPAVQPAPSPKPTHPRPARPAAVPVPLLAPPAPPAPPPAEPGGMGSPCRLV